jgi:hypothetical protein
MMGDGTLCYVNGINEKRFAAADCFGAEIEEIRAPEISPRRASMYISVKVDLLYTRLAWERVC